MSNQNTVKIMAKAMKDEAFRQQLLSHPKTTLERELGVTLPDDLTILVYEDTPTTRHLVLPRPAPPGEAGQVADAELETVVGGLEPSTAYCSFNSNYGCPSGGPWYCD
jgi:hypothetical protein